MAMGGGPGGSKKKKAMAKGEAKASAKAKPKMTMLAKRSLAAQKKRLAKCAKTKKCSPKKTARIKKNITGLNSTGKTKVRRGVDKGTTISLHKHDVRCFACASRYPAMDACSCSRFSFCVSRKCQMYFLHFLPDLCPFKC